MSPKPPDILRKSHRHTEGDERAIAKRELRDAIAEITEADDAPPENGDPAPAEHDDTPNATRERRPQGSSTPPRQRR